MSIRLPLTGILDYNDVGDVGAGSILGGVAKTFTLPQDTDNVVVKFTASTVGGAASVTFQTTDDGGTTWYDVARTSVVSNTSGNQNAQWLSIPVIGAGIRTAVTQSASVLTTGIGAPAASTLGGQQVSGLPILGLVNRVFLQYTAAVSANTLTRVEVKANNQDRAS